MAKVGASNVTTTTYYVGTGQEVQNGVPMRYYSLGGNTLGVRQGASVSLALRQPPQPPAGPQPTKKREVT